MKKKLIIIDGSEGEGGGQILRSSLSLSLLSGKPFKIENIRAKRKKPGIMRQHLTAVNAAASISGARVIGAEIGSTDLQFEPGEVSGGDYRFSVGSAGSTTLVCQTILLPLLRADKQSCVIFRGGTHNPYSPPFDFLAKTFIPLLRRMGASIEAKLMRSGFYPAGGGAFELKIAPTTGLRPLELLERGEIKRRWAQAAVSNLSLKIAKRELSKLRDHLGWDRVTTRAYEVKDSVGPGNVLTVEVESDHVCEVFTGFGEKGVSAEEVAIRTVDEVQSYISAEVPVGIYLADQLLMPLAVAGAGRFLTVTPSSHTKSNALVIERFLEVAIDFTEVGNQQFEIKVSAKNAVEG